MPDVRRHWQENMSNETETVKMCLCGPDVCYKSDLQPESGWICARAAREELLARIQNYLVNGGLFNPEMMEHEKVRDLLMDCRKYIAETQTPNAGLQR